MTPSIQLHELAARWSGVKAAERANAQSYIIELCAALGVEPPRPAGSGYEFELPIKLISRDGTETQGFIDCYKSGRFVLEAKDYEEGRSNDVLLRKAYGQARMYTAHDPSGVAPPYLLVLDVAKTMLVWDRWAGTFGGYPAARRIDLTRLHESADDVALLVDIWENPSARDPRMASQQVTREIAGHLAELAASLEHRGFAQEEVARFLMRCVFTCFAEDVGLLPDEPFRRLLDEIALPSPEEFPGAVEELWAAMDEGRRFGFRKLLRFNGHFFRDGKGLALTREDLAILLEAAKANWSMVEPSIFGTLLTRALDSEERHRLGAEYTPPEFIARLIRPTIEEPVRERWTAVQAEVLQLRESKKAKDRGKAETRLLEFHEWLRSIKVLDPACGSGNFLYMALHALKRVEVEVLHEIADIRGGALELRMHEVDPSQFYGIEVKPWAREIAELTLWIGFHQFWRQHHGNVQPEEPLLRDTGTLECRDAVLAWDATRHVPDRDRPDPTPRIVHPVTGELVPDPNAKLPYIEHVGAHAASWPAADFIVGNPPYIGNKRMRDALGDGYVDALRAAYPSLPDSIDLVMYWWTHAAAEVAVGRAIRAGLITTNSITQPFHQPLVAAAQEAGAVVVWAAPDHPWEVGGDAAAVRVAMTVLARDAVMATRIDVDASATITRTVLVPRLNSDLSAGADVSGAAAVPMRANAGLSSRGFTLVGRGFVLEADEAEQLVALDARHRAIIRPYRNGQDLARSSRGVYVIDFGLRNEAEAREYPVLFDILRDRVYSERQANGRKSYRELWWRFGEPRREMRAALPELSRYIATPYVARHRYFTFLDAEIAPDEKIVAIASDDPYVLGVLSSSMHAEWAAAAGTRLGVGNDLTYNNSRSFDSFPFPDPPLAVRAQISEYAQRLELHRQDALSRSDKVTMTGLHNVLAKLRTGTPLTAPEREVHTLAAAGSLLDLQDGLDSLVAEAYGWAWPVETEVVLERLVALHQLRVAEERAGTVRWVRPDFQLVTVGGIEQTEAVMSGDAPEQTAMPAARWPSDVIQQITALRQLAVSVPITVDAAVALFSGAPKAIVARHLETLAILGELHKTSDGRYASA
ncbi:MAG: class I SAM-dependent DNA methyltransferase [Gemmatimonadota bacterium]|nr:class I SAM-dependent DNA methyltransferase [Gemmatimonadota bacterium]